MYKFTIKGRPVPKKRPRVVIGDIKRIAYAIHQHFLGGKKVTLKSIESILSKQINPRAYTPKATKEYEKKIAYIAKCSVEEDMIEEYVSVSLKFYFKDYKEPDIDNCEKAVLDALHVVIKNDKKVKRVYCEKWMKYDEKGGLITKDTERTEVYLEVLKNVKK